MEATAIPILEFGRAWMSDGGTVARAEALGLKLPFGFWVNGRAGVLGEVDADVAAAAIGFMHAAAVRQYWDARPPELSARAAAVAYAEAAAAWAERVLSDWSAQEATELAALADRVAAASDPSVGVLFAGWRSLQVDTSPVGAAAIALNVLREHRGGAHLSAVNALGLGPVGAIISAEDQVRGGPAGASRFGWEAPYPTPDGARRAEAERATSRICAPAYHALSAGEGQRFAELVTRARAALDD